jgi:uncharacterized protein (TIGR02117 family)
MSFLGAVLRISCAALAFSVLAYSSHARAGNGWACTFDEKNCRAVFIVYDSWHAAIVLRKDDLSSTVVPELADFPDATSIEFSWGDKDYFPDPKSGLFRALKAAFWSRGSVMHVAGFKEDIGTFYPGAEIVALRLSPHAYERLIAFISQSFSRRHADGRAQASPGLYSYSRFYRSTGKFSVVNTCNTWVARALETAGVPVFPGLVISAAQLADQLEKIAGKR